MKGTASKPSYFSDAAAFLVLEAMDRSGGNQTLAARLLGISQPALSKRLKMLKELDFQREETVRTPHHPSLT